MWVPSGDEAFSTIGRTQRGLQRLSPERGVLFALRSLDESTIRHMERVEGLVGRTAVRLGLGSNEIEAVRRAAVLHDIGKSGIPRSILDKPGKLSEPEWEMVRRHPELGAKLLSGVFESERIRAAVAAHHERFDGRGYPAGLVGPDIPLEAHLIYILDAYDAMTHDRPYRQALSHERAIEQLDRGVGSQFDPAVVEAVKAVLAQHKDGDVGKLYFFPRAVFTQHKEESLSEVPAQHPAKRSLWHNS